MLRILAASLLLCAAIAAIHPPAATADNYANGATHGDYAYRDGYWWSGGYAYTRAKSYYYDACGRHRYRWTYSRIPNPYSKSGAYPPSADQLAGLNYKSPDWMKDLFGIAAQRDRYVLSERRAAIEQQYFLKAVDALGLSNNFGVQGYGQAVNYGGGLTPGAGFGSLGAATQTPAYGGQSIYGYSYSRVSDAYNQADRGELLNQYNNTTNKAYDLAGASANNLRDLILNETGTQERLGAIVAERDKAV
ncbi:MAG: hypothetical protein ACIALR_16560, partial [Blastopirellula sp. JB062]